MFAINHAATALVIKKHYPQVSLVWLLLSVQFVEILWVLLNFLGVERTTTNAIVNTVSDIHLEYMPYSHSIVTSVVFAIIAWVVVGKIYSQRTAALAVAIGIISHIILDFITHARDISIFPFLLDQKVGIGLYTIPLLAFVVETIYGLFCWWIFQGSMTLLVIILAFNLANITFFSVVLKGPEVIMANHPMWIVDAVAVQIIVTLILVWFLAKPRAQILEQQV